MLRDLLAQARGRIARQSAYAGALARGGARAAALEALLDRAGTGLQALARPQAVRVVLSPGTDGSGVRLAMSPDPATALVLADPVLADGLRAGGQLSAGLVTLGFDQEVAFAQAGGDYALHHVQTDLAREMLFAFARADERALRAIHPGWRLIRRPVRVEDACGGAVLWDAARVQALLALFGARNPGVGLTETGFFRPLHALLGLSLLVPPGQPVTAACSGLQAVPQSGGG